MNLNILHSTVQRVFLPFCSSNNFASTLIGMSPSRSPRNSSCKTLVLLYNSIFSIAIDGTSASKIRLMALAKETSYPLMSNTTSSSDSV